MTAYRDEMIDMSHALTVEEGDCDGQLREAADQLGGDTRAGFLRKLSLLRALTPRRLGARHPSAAARAGGLRSRAVHVASAPLASLGAS